MIILRVILLVITIALIIIGLFEVGENNYGDPALKFKPNKRIALAIIPVILFVGTMCIVTIPSNTVGIKWSMISGTSENTLDEGIAFKSPFDKVYKLATTVQEQNMSFVVQTKDAQFLTVEANVKFQVNKANAFKVYKRHTTIDNLKVNVMSNYTQKSMSSVVTGYNIIDVLGEKQNEVYTLTTDELTKKLEAEGVNLVELTIKDMDAGADIENAIKMEAVQQKAVETARQKQEQAKIEAETKLIEAEGEAKANAVKTKALTDEVLAEMWINKWNGVLPSVSGSEGIMIDVNSLLGE